MFCLQNLFEFIEDVVTIAFEKEVNLKGRKIGEERYLKNIKQDGK